jgi:5-formyltetrahydrofolate cyclo-ligase
MGRLVLQGGRLLKEGGELQAWRRAERDRLVALRMAVPAARMRDWRGAIDRRLEGAFPDLGRGVIGFCWPFRNEYDARHLLRRMRDRGALTALPVVVAPGTPLIFRLWKPGDALGRGVYGIPYPASTPQCTPDTLLVPMNGFDLEGYRLGYGGGYFDRTIAALPVRPRLIGVCFELAAMPSIRPQAYDIPMDFVATEERLYRRGPEGLVQSPG